MRRDLPILRGRGAARDLPNRFQRLRIEFEEDVEAEQAERPTRYFTDPSRSALTRNDSPDVGFEWSLNPYRGCVHGCSYCYARPTHEYLEMSPGLDFETRILVKRDAPGLLRRELSKKNWRPSPIAMSGVTDPYQPIERKLEITRRCLEVLEETGHPVTIVTKSALVERDIDLLGSLAQRNAAQVVVSVTTLDRRLQRAMEPRAAPPEHRLRAIGTLSSAGIPVLVMVAPVIPGLTDHEVPRILEAVADAGATAATYVNLRLPGPVKDIFLEWLDEHLPDRAGKVRSRLRELHGGKLSDPRFGHRMRGSGPYADYMRRLFRVTASKAGLGTEGPRLSVSSFVPPARPGPPTAQLDLLS